MKNADERRGELLTYGIGYLLALALTGAAFAAVVWPAFPAGTTFAIVLGLALVQAIVHFRCFLHITMQRASRHDLQLILFSTLIIVMMVGGTLVLLMNLRGRMM
ncbi:MULTISPECIES: cytochrome C oxidase subunit IV family protein [unclassified Sphingomonas]|uniref:cytochrome o ubiquinol oxidase subunit IV n=1 Tax=unclassified Sphingomonas TaxID=196159 RepID=UPI001F59CAB2|nr:MULTISPECIES: cytochrome C oxidase subunit IV family protein [unclassified Sphingomonas]